MSSNDTEDMLPPALRMAAGSSSSSTSSRPRRSSSRVSSSSVPGKSKSFVMRKEQADALAKIRCQPRQDMIEEDQKRKQILLRRQSNKSKRDIEAQERRAKEQSETIMETLREPQQQVDATAGEETIPEMTSQQKLSLSWQRSSESSPVGNSNSNRLRHEAAAMRERIKQLQLEEQQHMVEDGTMPAKKQHSQDILEKKLEKVEKLLAKEVPGTKEYKKLFKKKEQYEAELEELVMEQMQTQSKADAIAKAKEEAAEVEALAEQAEQQEAEQAEIEAEAEEQQERARLEAKAEEEAAAEAAAAEAKAKAKQKEDEEQERQAAADAKAQEEVAASPSPSPSPPPMDEKERIRQERIEEYRRKVAQKKEEEEQTKRQAERLKEFKVLKKKLQKLEGMIDDAKQQGKDTTKLDKKQQEYISQLEHYDEWQEELKAREKAAEEERVRKEKEEAEKQRKAALEEERRQKAEEEAQRRRIEAEEAEKRRQQLGQERQAEQERLQKEKEEEQRRLAAEEEERRIKDAEEAEAKRIEEEERAARHAKEEEERAEREAKEAEQRKVREAELATERAEQEKINAERRRQEEEEAAQRREELREQTKAAEADAAASASVPAQSSQNGEEASQDFVDRHNIPEPHSANTKKILGDLEQVEERQAKLEKTLKQNGIPISEDIPYEVAKDRIAELQEQMKNLATSEEDQFVVQKKYNALEEELSKYITAMMLTDEFAEEQRIAEQKWEESIEVDNIAALRKVRSHMPVNIRNMSEDELTNNPTPNGKMLPKTFAKKFKRSNVLQLIRVNPDDLERMHPSLIEGLRSTGLTLTERRALHEHLKDIGATWQEKQQDPSIERKYSWFLALKSKFKEMVTAYDKHVQEYGRPGNHPYAKRNDPKGGGCPLIGNQCPVKADAALSYDDDYGFTQEAEYEGGSSGSTPSKAAKSANAKSGAKKGGGSKAKDEEIMASVRERLHLVEAESTIDSKLIRELFHAEKRAVNLEKQLTQNGLALPKEDITYAVAKAKIAEITEDIKVVASKMGETTDMKEMARLEKEYTNLSDDLEKYNNALMLTKEWAEELLEKERQWEERVKPDNIEALRKIRRHMPVNIKDLSEQDMTEGTTPNGKQLPQKIVRKFKRTNILQLVRMPPSMIEPMHPSSLEAMRSTGLTLTERRALHEHLKDLGAKWKAASNDKMAERKWMWHESLRGKFKELVDKYQQHVDEYGPPSNHPYAKRGEPGGGCPLIGKQCPVKADQEVDYSDDYGFPPDDVYNVEKVKKSNLLTVEELERRKQDEDWGYDAPAQEEPEPAQPPTAGLMAAIGARGTSGRTDTSDAKPPAPKIAGGLKAAIAFKGGDDDGRSKMGGGLMDAIKGRGSESGQDAGAKPAPPKMGGGLLAAIQSKDGASGDDELPAVPAPRPTPAPAPAPAPVAAPAPSPSPAAAPAAAKSQPSPKKRTGRGLLAAITGKGKGKK